MPAKDLDTWLGEATNLTDTEIKTATEQCRAAGVHTLGQLIQHLKTSSINELFSDALVRSEVDKGLQAKERAPLTMRLVRQFSTWRSQEDGQQWSDSLFDCINDGRSCCKAYCCPWCSVGAIVSSIPPHRNFFVAAMSWLALDCLIAYCCRRIPETEWIQVCRNHGYYGMICTYCPPDYLSFSQCQSDPPAGYLSWKSWHTFALLLFVAQIGMLVWLRAVFRNRLDISGSHCADCVVVFFCSCCALAQMDRHLQISANRDNCYKGWLDPGPHRRFTQQPHSEEPSEAVANNLSMMHSV
jgi:Cys-rich protein (TIGR01571 family)